MPPRRRLRDPTCGSLPSSDATEGPLGRWSAPPTRLRHTGLCLGSGALVTPHLLWAFVKHKCRCLPLRGIGLTTARSQQGRRNAKRVEKGRTRAIGRETLDNVFRKKQIETAGPRTTILRQLPCPQSGCCHGSGGDSAGIQGTRRASATLIPRLWGASAPLRPP